MKYYKKIDLSKLPKPTIIDEIDVEQVVKDMEEDHEKMVRNLNIPGVSSGYKLSPYDPVRIFYKIAASYQAMNINKINQAFAARVLSHASEEDLDNLVIENGTVRDGEDDSELRQKYLKTFSNLNTAGSFESYVYHVLESIDGENGSKALVDCYPYSDEKTSIVKLVILPRKEIMVAPEDEKEEDREKNETERKERQTEIVKKVQNYFDTNKNIRPLTNKVEVVLAKPVIKEVKIDLDIKEGVSKDLVKNNAIERLEGYINSSYRIGFDIYTSAIIHYVMSDNIENCKVKIPSEDVLCGRDEVFICSKLIVDGGEDE